MIYNSCRSITLGRDFFFALGKSAAELCDSHGRSPSCGRFFDFADVAPASLDESTRASNIFDYANSTDRFLRPESNERTRTRWQV